MPDLNSKGVVSRTGRGSIGTGILEGKSKKESWGGKMTLMKGLVHVSGGEGRSEIEKLNWKRGGISRNEWWCMEKKKK